MTEILLKLTSGTPVEINDADMNALRMLFAAKLPADSTLAVNGSVDGVTWVSNYTIPAFDETVSYGPNTVRVHVDSSTATVSIDGYQAVADSDAITLTSAMHDALKDRNVVVTVENNGSDSSRPTPTYFSLAAAHRIYQALLAGAVDPASIAMDSVTLTPLYKGSEWVKINGYDNADPEVTLYSAYPNETALMQGIKVKKVGGLYVVEYDRPIVVEDIVYYKRADSQVRGTGLYKGTGTIAPKTGNWADVLIAGYIANTFGERGYGFIGSPEEYFANLADAGLMYTGGSTPSPTHKIGMGVSNPNLFANGIYKWLKDHKDGNRLSRLDNVTWGAQGWKLDGSVYEGLADRRIATTGRYNEAFAGNVPTDMVNLLRGKFGAGMDFSNINIIGPGSTLASTSNLHLANVSLVGDYTNIGMGGTFYGLLDLDGDAPIGITNDVQGGYLTIYKASVGMKMNKFAVLHVRTTELADVKNIGAGNNSYSGSLVPLQAIIFENKRSVSQLGFNGVGNNVNDRVPHNYKVVYDQRATGTGHGTYKFLGAQESNTSDGFYLPYFSPGIKNLPTPSEPVPSIDQQAWRQAGNSKTTPTAGTWSATPAEKKWTSADFAAAPIVQAIIDTGIHLADAVRFRLFGREIG
ncbi:MAG: hypothetical protein LBC31_05640 [Treponema sp.]|nr:hypothetical protein [Treponema sp.]